MDVSTSQTGLKILRTSGSAGSSAQVRYIINNHSVTKSSVNFGKRTETENFARNSTKYGTYSQLVLP